MALSACAPKGDALYARAEQALAKGEVRAAVIDLKNLVKEEPQNAKARALLASALASSGDIVAAGIEVEKARQLGAPDDTLMLADCRVMLARGQFEDVVAKCGPGGAPDASRNALRIVQGQALLGLERGEEAKQEFDAVLAAEPGNLDAILGLASAQFQVGGLVPAQGVFDRAPAEAKKNPRFWLAVGSLRMQGGDPAGAEEAMQKAVESLPKDAETRERLVALGGLAEAQMRQSKLAEAGATLETLSKVAPRNPVVKQMRAQVAAAGGNLDEARTLLEETVAAMPDNYDARFMLGTVNMMQGNLGQAEMHLANVVSNRPGDVRAQKQLAEVRAKLRSPAASMDELAPALEQPGVDPGLLAFAGRMSLEAGDRDRALEYLSKAEAAQSGAAQSADVQLEVATGYLMAGDVDRAVDLLEKIPADAASSLQRQYLLLLALLRKGDVPKALAETEALLSRSGNSAEARNLAGGVYAAAGKPEEARKQFEMALKIAPKDTAALLNMARLDIIEGKSADAERRFREVMAVDPKSLVGALGLASLATAAGNSAEAEKWLKTASREHPDSSQAQAALAQYYLGRGDTSRASEVAEAASKQFPNDASIENIRGLASLGAGDLSAAASRFRRASELAPAVPAYALNLARALMLARDFEGALDVLDAQLAKTPTQPTALALAANAAIQAKQDKRAAGYVERLERAAPGRSEPLIAAGDLAMSQKRYGDARRLYREAAAKAPSQQLTFAQYRAAQLAGAPDAVKILEDAVQANPGDVAMIANLAEARAAAGDRSGAIKVYEQGLKASPDDVILLNNLAVLLVAAGDSRGLVLAKRALDKSPRNPLIQDTYGWALQKQGKSAEAIPILRGALKAVPDNPEIQYHLAVALAATGEKSEAASLLRTALQGPLPDGVKAEAQGLLDKVSR
jgi:putative PEP-CTERM system TPR-repeat lipoprotein